ncbi:MAG TPA: polymer-forming cytoskeletal protein [Bacilli bacterium]
MIVKRKNRVNPNTTETLIGKGTLVDGKLVSEASLRIEGKFVGDIVCDGDVTIGENSSVHSNIQARNVINAGTVHGSIVTREMLRITATGKVFGSIQVQTLHILEGGIFHGTSKMEEQTKEKNAAIEIAKPLDKKRDTAKVEKLASGN